jgi:hypothetical protein
MYHSSFIRFVLAAIVLAATSVSLNAQDQSSSTELAKKFARHFEDRPPLMFEVETEGAHAGRILVTNLSQYPLTAIAIEIAKDPESELPSQINICDSLTRSQLLAPIPRGLSFVTFAGHVVGGPIPNASLVAAIWEDGSTFGSKDLLNQLLENRRATLTAIDRVLSILQSGVGGSWNRAQYLSALEVAGPPSLVPITTEQARTQIAGTAVYYGAKSTISTATDRDRLLSGVKALQKVLKQERDRLANSAPAL